MANLTRYLQKIFASTAGANEIAEFGSLIGDPPGNLYSGSTINPDIVQQLSQFEGGLYAATAGAYSPTIQDQNALFWLCTRQLAYLYQKGVPEWDSGTTYYIHDFAKVNSTLYISLQNTNLNNAPASSPTYWEEYLPTYIAPTIQIFTTGSGTYTLPTSPRTPLYIRVTMVGGGGGGGGSGKTTAGSTGGNGDPSTFGAILTANGGGGGSDVSPGAGGTASFSSGSGVAFQGQPGGDVSTIVLGMSSSVILFLVGGDGGQSIFGGGGRGGGYLTLNGTNAKANTGSGGGGGGISADSAAVFYSGAAGGAAGYLDVIISSPSSSYAYAVGNGGSGGAAGTSGNAGANGASGIIIVQEFYQ